ncbi:MAG: hypothetical protein WAL26_26470 [Mycobacterium sp.]
MVAITLPPVIADAATDASAVGGVTSDNTNAVQGLGSSAQNNSAAAKRTEKSCGASSTANKDAA